MTTKKREDYAPVVTFEEFDRLRPGLGRVVCTSGGFDPIHPGHISCIADSRRLGDTVVVVVNGDGFLRAKKGKPFQDMATRVAIVSALKAVDYVIPFEVEGDATVREALRRIRPDVFSKGGDRVNAASIPEWDICQELGILVVTGVGAAKAWSSSNFLAEWEQFRAETRQDDGSRSKSRKLEAKSGERTE